MKRRDLRNEAEHLPITLEQLVELRAQVLELGESRRVADGLCMWLVAKANHEPDTTAPDTRSNYRKILQRLEELEPVGPGRGDRGHAALTASGVAIGGAVAAVVALVTRDANMALAVAAPVILDEPRYVEQEQLAA